MGHRHTLALVGILFLLGATSAADRRDAFPHAAAHGDIATVQALLAEGVDIEVRDAFDWTALMLAMQHRHTAMVRTLVEQGAALEARGFFDRTALMLAAAHGGLATVQVLLTKEADIEARDAIGQTALILAAQRGHAAIVRTLVARGVDIQASDVFGRTALIVATTLDHTAVIRVLHAASAGEPTPPSQPRAGPSRAQIRQAQQRLRAAGFNPGPLDGIIGARTTEALRDYQHAHGLAVTGGLDAATRQALGLDWITPRLRREA